MRTTRLKVTLHDVTPMVIRVVDVPAAGSLAELHHVLQAAVGWTDSHLHLFVGDDDSRFGVVDDDALDAFGDEGIRSDADATLRDLPARFTYLYDFGDEWEHTVEVLGPGRDRPGCVFADGACPPEDCGGPEGYAHLLQVLTDPRRPEDVMLQQWIGDPALPEPDQAAVDVAVRNMVGEVPATVRMVLDLVGEGVKLTPAGRLPRSLVRAVQEHHPDWHPVGTPASIEEDLYPLPALHALMRATGLLRLRKGVLLPTRAAADDRQIVRRLRVWLTRDDLADLLSALVAAELAVHGPRAHRELAAAITPYLVNDWTNRDGRPVSAEDVDRNLLTITDQLRALDVIGAVEPQWKAGGSALTLHPRATLMAQVLTRD